MVYGFYNLYYKAKKYLPLTKKEWNWLYIAIPLMAIVGGFDDGSESFQLGTWIANYLLVAVILAIIIAVHEVTQRLTGLEQAFKITSKPFLYGLLGGVLLSLMTNGRISLMVHKSFHMDTLEAHRLGYFRYHRSYFAMGKTAFIGQVSIVLTAIFVKYIPVFPDFFAEKFAAISMAYVISNMLPIPPLDGALLMYASRLIYFFTFGAIIGIAVVLHFGANIWILMGAAIIMGLLMHYFYFGFAENKLGGKWES